MRRRAAAAVLWFFSMWYAGATLAYLIGLSPALGPILGTAAAALIAGDPRGIIWTWTPKVAKPRSASRGRAIQTPV
jgi:hypothetical protein